MTPCVFARRTALRSVLVIGTACWLAACASGPDNAGDVLARSSTTMGAANAKSLRYVAEGTGYTFGQAFKSGGAWPRITVHSLTRTIDYDKGAMRDEIVLSRAEPTGGGGYPLSGQQRNDQLLNGDLAWNQTPGGAVPGPRLVSDRVHQLWITPHGVIKAAARNNAEARRGADGGSTLTFVEPGRFSATAQISSDGLVTQVDSVFPDPVLGDTRTVTSYSDYRDVGGVKFPTRSGRPWAASQCST